MATKQTATPTTLAPAIQNPTATLGNGGFVTPIPVTLEPSANTPTIDQALWVAIRNRTNAIGFEPYAAFIDRLLCERQTVGSAACPPTSNETSTAAAGAIGSPSIDERLDDLAARPSIAGRDAYELLKLATEAFLLFEGGVSIQPPRAAPSPAIDTPIPGEATRLGQPVTWEQAQAALTVYLQTQVGTIGERALPYLKRVVDALLPPGTPPQQGLPFCDGLLNRHATCPLLAELYWSYCQEQGYLVQALNAIALRYQNHRRGPNDPLANLALDPLVGLSNLMWGFVQDRERLSVAQRVLGYQYSYGLTLQGKAAAGLQPVERRARFSECFAQLLNCVSEFYAADQVTTMRPDGFKLLQALKDLHLELAQSANNQTWELTRAARAEMLVMQYLLARPEMAGFLRGRAMVPHRERWMPQIETMKRLQGWPQMSAEVYRALGETGEKVLLSVRLGDWVAIDDQQHAMNWARYFKPEIQTYLHARRALDGRDLAARRVELQPAPHALLPEMRVAEIVDDGAPAWTRTPR